MTPTHSLARWTRSSPVGELTLIANDDALVGLFMEVHRADALSAAGEKRRTPLIAKVSAQLDEYFAGRRARFDVPVAPRGTDFQTSVWQVLKRIPFGVTWSYARVARELGNPKAVRAVGAANGSNPISIIIPCHRVIGANGSLTGYGGGLPRKRWLLAHEKTEPALL